MNWTKSAFPLALFWRFALPFCVTLLAVSVWANDIELDENGLLNVENGVISLDSSALEDLELAGIIIKEGGVLRIENDTSVSLKGMEDSEGFFEITIEGGTLNLLTSEGTKIFTGELDEEGRPMSSTLLFIDGGVILITEGEQSGELSADMSNIRTVFGEKGAVLDVAEGLLLKNGGIYQYETQQKGEGVLKIGEGTWKVDVVSMGTETLNIFEGTLEVSGSASIGTLNVGEWDHQVESAFPVSEGTVKFFGGANASIDIKTLNVDAGRVHFLDNAAVGISKLNSHVGTTISGLQYGEEDQNPKKSNLTITNGGNIEGILENIGELTLSGETLVTSEGILRDLDNLILSGGMLKMEGTLENIEELTLYGGTLAFEGGTHALAETDILVYEAGKISVAEGATFRSGDIGWRAVAQTGSFRGLIVDGGGTFQAADIDLGKGWLALQGEGTAMIVDSVKAERLEIAIGTEINVSVHAEFNAAVIAGNYIGNGSNLTIKEGASVTGSVVGIGDFKLDGTLLLAADNTTAPTISTDTWTLSSPNSARIRILAGTESGTYQRVLQVTNDASRQDLLTVLRSSKTSLYHPVWSESGTYLDLQLSTLTVNEYINKEWRKSGGNINSIGALLEDVGMRYPAFRERLEGLSDTELRNLLRSTLAGELAGNAMRFAMQRPETVFRHLDGIASLRSPFTQRTTRGQTREGFNVWFNPYGQTEHAQSDAVTFDGYNMSRFGFYLGSDIEIYKQAVAGALFGYSNPYVKSDLGKISANDYTAGLYLRMPFERDFVLNAIVGFGSQDYAYRSTTGKSHFRGSSFFSSLELAKPFVYSSFRLTPLAALDFQSATMKDFTVRDSVLDGGILVEPGSLNSAVLRIGLLGEVSRFRSRIQYMYQMAEKDFVSSQTSLLGDELAAAARIRGTQWGEDWLNAGLGCVLLKTRHWRIAADYDFDLGKRTTSHLGSINTVLKW